MEMDQGGIVKSRGLYAVSSMHNLDLEQKRTDILEPLRKFAPRVLEEFQTPFKYGPPISTTEVRVRPVTVKNIPKTFDQLANIIKKQICPDADISYISFKDQQSLAEVVTSELRSVWKDISTQPQHPLLDHIENNQLKKRVVTHIVTASVELYHHYIQKMLVLNERGVFTAPANSARLRAQLGLDLNRLLNINTIRRHIFSDIHSCVEPSDGDDVKRVVKSSTVKRPTFASLVEKSRPAIKFQRITKPRREVKDLMSKMPEIDMAKVMSLIPDLDILLSPSPCLSTGPPPQRRTKDPSSTTPSNDEIPSSVIPKNYRSQSVPMIDISDDLFLPPGVAKDWRMSSAAPLTHTLVEDAGAYRRGSLMTHPKSGRHDNKLTALTPADDLINLMSGSRSGTGTGTVEEDIDEDERMPPLLQASSKYGHVPGRLENLLEQLRQLEEKEEIRRRKQRELITESKNLLRPMYPQPATVSTKIRNQNLSVRASDIRVSERVNITSLTLSMFQPIYNDLTDDIDPSVVKEMDQRLFRGDELKDVYQELVKTLSNDHLIPDQDDDLEPAADQLDLSNLLSSSTLNRKPAERIINKDLIRINTDHIHTAPLTQAPLGQGSLATVKGAGVKSTPAPPPPPPVSKASREYASWMNWWKSLINADDYMKYLSMQETDFLSVLFHFYDSDAEDEDEEITEEMMEKERKVSAKKAQLKSLKTDFNPGLWNVNSVLLGGLGKDPEVDRDQIDQEGGEEEGEGGQVDQKGVTDRLVLSSGHLTRVFDPDFTDDEQKSKHKKINRRGHKSSAGSSSVGGGRGQIDMTSTDTALSEAQARMEAVWNILQLPDEHRINLALKYSSEEYYDVLYPALDAWEHAAKLIQKRESIIEQLERFERYASDPNRFFERGYRGSSKARLVEACKRSELYSQLDHVEKPVLNSVRKLDREFHDRVTYQNRPYLNKMKLDRTEMLYWLQQERRKEAVVSEIGDATEFMFNSQQKPLKNANISPPSICDIHIHPVTLTPYHI